MLQKNIPFALLGVGVGLAGYSSARPISVADQAERISAWLTQSGLLFFIGIALIIAAAVLMRRQAAAAITNSDSSPQKDPTELLAELQAGAQEVRAALDSEAFDVSIICARIDALRDGAVQGLVDAKAALIARHGMLAYAQFISAVSAAERNLNRTWSTLVDGYPDEARKAAGLAASLAAAVQPLR